MSCSQLATEKASIVRQELSSYISDALDHAPSIVIFDDLDSIISSSSDLEGSQPSTSVAALTEFLTDIMDEYGVRIIYGLLVPHFPLIITLILMVWHNLLSVIDT